ncbi:uncharacterized protein HfgLR_09320 [Haloferax gibbonsii]|uniref:Uncharacterized protein n=1 Tax=Haloferax gibbonsii TaxID=35746 RepID=A0A871BGS2_HALGI|nr:hypothetical protein [Haloferax gibbonsii]QOS12005.1 uncharacterized protein HfgLR_09320 [Haloferax gibbonsii]
MPSTEPRTPEVEVSEDVESGFVVNIYDGENLIQVRPNENGYQLSLASKTGMGDAAFLRTYSREERYRRLLETEFESIDSDAVFEVLYEHFGEQEYRIVNLKRGPKTFGGRGAHLYIETGESIPTLTGARDYRDDQWSKDETFRFTIWPTDDLWIEVREADSGNMIADYRPFSLMEDIRNEEKDDHDRERGPTSVPGVHAPISSGTLDGAPVVHTHINCPHLDQLKNTRYNPAGEVPPQLPAEGFGELPLRWCSKCAYMEPTPDEIRERYGP